MRQRLLATFLLGMLSVHTALAAELPPFPKDRVTKEVEITAADGIKLHGWQMASAREARGNVVIIHGMKDAAERYIEFGKQLSEAGYQVFAFDLRGHARSGGDAVYLPSMDVVMSDVQAAMKTFRQDDNQKPWFLLGHSAGGAITARYATDHPSELAGYLISAPAIKRSPDLSGILEGLVKTINAVAPSVRVLDLPNEKFSQDKAVVADMVNNPLICNCKLPARTAVTFLDNMDYLEANRGKVNTPFFIFHGDHDEINNIEGTREFFAGTADIPGKKMRIYEGMWHDLLHEPQKAQVATDIIEWINVQSAKTPNKV